MPKFLVELEDGKKFQVEADQQPSPEEISQYLGGQTQPEKPFLDLSETASSLGRAVTSLPTTTMASLSQAWEGLENPWKRSEGYLSRRQEMQALQDELAASEAEAAASGDISTVSSAIREATPSLGFSGATLLPSLGAGAGTLALSRSPAAARGAAAATSALMAYRMAGAQFLDDAKERIDNFFQEKVGRLPTEQEQNEAYQELLPLARKFGAAEAGPEALGNLALGGAGKYIRRALGGKGGIVDLASNALGKVTGTKAALAGAGAMASEIGTEAVTGVEQERVQRQFEEGVMRGESPESVALADRSLGDYTRAIEEVAPATIATVGMMGAAGLGPRAISRGIQAIRGPKTQAEQAAEEQPSMPLPDEIVIAEENLKATQNVPFTDITDQAATNIVQENARIASQLAVSTEQATEEVGAEVTPSPAMEMPSPPQGVDMASAPVSPIITEAPLSEGAERNRAVIAEAAAKLRGEAPQDISAGLQAAIPQQPVETQEDATRKIPLQESVRQEPQDGVESRETEETGAGDQLLSPAEGEGEVISSPKLQAVESVFNAIQSHLANGGDFQIPGNPPLRITKKNANQFSVSSDGDLMFKRGKKGGVIPITDVAVIGSQVGSPFDVLSLFEGREVERPVTSDALAIAESDNGVSFERLSSLIGDRQKAADEIETLTGKDVFSAWPIVVDAVADSVSVSNGQFVDTDAKAEKLRSLYREAQEMPASKERADAIEQITLASNINQSNRDSIKRKKITQPGEPTTATEGMVTPGGVASLGVAAEAQPEQPDAEWAVLSPTQWASTVGKAVFESRMGKKLTKKQAADFVEAARKGETVHKLSVEDAVTRYRNPVSAEAVDSYGIKLPEGYVKQGDLYVFQPQTTAAEKQVKQTSPKKTKPAKLDESKAIAEYPDLETFFEREVLPSGKKGGWVLKEKRTGARLSSGKTKEEASADFRKSLLWQQAWNEEYPSVFEMVNKLIEDKSINAEKYSQSYKVKPSKEEWLSILEGKLAELRQDREDTIKQNRSVGARPNTEFVDNFIANVEARLAKLQTTAAETQTPVPLRGGTGAAGVASSSLGGGRSPELTQVSTETETTSSEKLDPKLIEAERKQAKEEAAAAKKQQAGEEMRSKAIDSIIGASEKKKRKFGQVTNSDAIAAVAMLVSSKDVPGVLTTWVGTKEDFLRDPANQLADPEIYARIKAGELVEGFFNKGRAYVFLDGVGVSENDMLRGEQMDVSPQIAAVRRVLLHESLVHRGIHGLPLRHRRLILNWVRQNSTPEELDDLAKLYTEYANWRDSEFQFEALAEELLAKKVDSLTEIPKDGPMARLMDILRQIWDFIVGYKREPTLSDLKSVVKLLKSGAEALSNDTLKDGGQVKLSMIAPTSGITPEQDAEYLAAVEAGDMEKAQRMVDEAAKAAGYDAVGYRASENTGLEPFPGNLAFAAKDQELAKWFGAPKRVFIKEGFNPTKDGDLMSKFFEQYPIYAKGARSGFETGRLPFWTGQWDLQKWLQDNNVDYDSLYFVENGAESSVAVKNLSQLKLADPVTYDDAGNVIPLSQRFQTTSSDIRFSRPEFASETSAAFTAGSEAARSTLYSERDMDIREALRRAYEAMPKTNSVAVPIGELFAKTAELMPGVTQDEFSNVLQDLFEDNGAVFQEGESDFFVTTPEGRRAGFVVVMPRAAKASRIPIEDAVDVSKSFKADLAEAGRGRVDTKAKFKGKLLKDTEIPEHNVKSYPLYRNGAIKLIDDLMAKTNDILAVAESLQDPEFQMAVGLQVSNDVSSEMITIARSQIGFDIGRRLTDAIKNEKNPRRKRELELAKKKGIIYYNAGTGAGQALQNRQESMDDPLYKGQIIFDQAELQKDKKAKEKLDAITGGTEKITDIITGAEQKAAEETTQAEVEAQESAAEDDEYANLVSEGEAELTNEEKGLWERAKMLLRRFAMYAKRKGARAANAAKASLSAEQRKELDELNAIMKMSDEEAAKAESKDRAEFAAVLKKLLGEEKPNDTPQQKKTRQKRVKMIDVVRRYVESGKPIDLSDQQTALKGMLREMNKARPADSVPLERAMPWRKILSSKPKDVAEYRQRILEAVSSIESFQNLTEEQKERLADLYAEAWEERRQAILDRMLRDEIKKARDRDEISDDVEKKLQQSRNKILEIINLGGFNNDDLVKILGERYGISASFTEEQKERIQKLADQLQDEDMNTAKRNKLAMEFAVELAGAMDVPVTEIIANWWTSSVLFGPQTIFSIGAAFLNGGYSITTIGTRRMLAKLFKGDVQGSLEESILMLKGIARYLGAFKQAGRRAWNYLWSGDVGLLGIGSNDILSEISNFEQLQRFQRHKLLAEQLAKDPKRVRRYVGIYLRFVSRLLTALDAFNVMVTKAGTASLALRMSGMSTENIIKAEKMLNLKAYKDQVIRDYFDNKAPKTQAEKALVDSYAEAEMYRAIDKMGGKMENADYLASESAMTMHPTGFGGVIYDAITGFFAQRQANADEYLEKMKKDWVTRKDLTSVTFLALAYLRQFAAYNAAGLTGSKFVRYASNKFNQGLSFIPFAGLLRQLEAKDDRIKGKDAFIETIYRNQVVGALMLFIGGAVLGAIEDEPDDEERGTFWNGGWANLTPDQKKQLLAKGQKEYTMGFKYNGRWYVFNYQNWPLNQMLSAIGSMSDQIRFSPKQWNEKNLLSKTVAGMVSGVKSTLEIPALSGLQELVGNRLASKDPTEQSLDRISRVASGWVGGFVPRILKDIDFATQPELRKYETLWEKTASHIPIYRRYVGEEYYDILGKPIKRNVIPGSREFMMGPTEPEYKILGALNSRNIFLTPANAEYRMVGKGRNRRRLTQEEADAYSLETGKGYRQMLLRYGQRALQMPTERARAFLSDKADEVRDRALKKVYRGYTK